MITTLATLAEAAAGAWLPQRGGRPTWGRVMRLHSALAERAVLRCANCGVEQLMVEMFHALNGVDENGRAEIGASYCACCVRAPSATCVRPGTCKRCLLVGA